MRPIVALLDVYTPLLLRRRKLDELFAATADTFDCEPPSLGGLSYDACLHAYATFTREQVEGAIRSGRDMAAIDDRLYQAAYRLGRDLRRLLRVRSMEDVMAAARVLYRCIGIDFEGTPEGAVTIWRCYFSEHYSSQVCQVVSALDSGVLAGLAGDGRLVFTQRITDGFDHCAACFSRTECQA